MAPRNKRRWRAVVEDMTHSTILNGRDLLSLITEQEKERRAARDAHRRSGAAGVHADQNKKRYNRRDKSWQKGW